MKCSCSNLLIALAMFIFSSCSKDGRPVVEVYFSFVNAGEYDNISIDPSRMYYGSRNIQTGKPSSQADFDLDRGTFNISKIGFNQKTFVTSQTIWKSDIQYIAIDSQISLEREDGMVYDTHIHKFNSVFPSDFLPEDGEAYEIHFIFDIGNSVI